MNLQTLDESVGRCTAFNGTKRIASGNLREVALKSKQVMARDRRAQVLIFDDLTSELIEVDFRGTAAELSRRLAKLGDDSASRELPQEAEARGPGRPRLGVVAREVTLLPRHWEWLASQPGGASVALRKLVELAIKSNKGQDSVRRAQESAYRFVTAMAGNEPGYEEAIRALFAGRQARFHAMIESWPADVRGHAKKLAAAAFVKPGKPEER
jgi:hypothetical protein